MLRKKNVIVTLFFVIISMESFRYHKGCITNVMLLLRN